MLFTNEYTILKSQDGGKDIIIKPGKINAFEPIEGKFISTSYARILDTETLKQVCQLEVGKLIDGVGVIEVTPKKRTTK
jgi:hypothetical protein